MKARSIAFIFALFIALMLALAFSVLANELNQMLLVCFTISFVTSFLVIYFGLDFLIFKQLKGINKAIDLLKERDLEPIKFDNINPLNPLKVIQENINGYALSKQKEIQELRKMEAFRREFIADVSHELKTPIFSAQGFIHTLLDGAINDKSVRKQFLKKAAKNLDGLDALVQDLLTLSQMETGQIKMQFDKFNIYTLAAEVIEQLVDKANQKDIIVDFVKNCEKEVFVYADRQRIYHVMLNLISNAINYSDNKADVEIDFEKRGNMVRTIVKDYGMGIAPAHAERIFERFYRVDKSRSKEKGGTGLGLAIVKHIIEGHNSKVEVTSELGKGATFSFELAVSL